MKTILLSFVAAVVVCGVVFFTFKWADGAGYFQSTLSTGTSTWPGVISVDQANSTSTFAGGLNVKYLNQTGTSATSTFARGINLGAGCFAIAGNCISFGSLSGTVDISSQTNLTAGDGLTLTNDDIDLDIPVVVSSGGTGKTTFGQGWIYSEGGTTALAASTSPTVNYLTATSTTATSTFMGGLQAKSFHIEGTATSTSNANIVAPCFANSLGGTCLGAATVPTAITVVPKPLLGVNLEQSNGGGGNTTAYFSQVAIPTQITVNKVSIRTGGVINTAGQMDISLYSQDGQTQYFSTTTIHISSTDTTYVNTLTSPVVIPAGVYWFVVNANQPAIVEMRGWETSGSFTCAASDLSGDVTGEAVLAGTMAIASGTPPTTFTPTSITCHDAATFHFRLDN